jgi:hypothetical protein
MKLLYTGGTACSGDTLGRLFLLGSELCFLDRPSVMFDNWGTIGHESNLRRFSSQGLPVRISVLAPPSGGAQQCYAPYVEADLTNPAFVGVVLDGLREDQTFAEKLLPPAANYGSGRTGIDVRRALVNDPSLRNMTFDLARSEDPGAMYRPDLPEGRRQIARTLIVEASIEVTSALLMSEELDALPVADDTTYPRLLSLRTSNAKYIGGVSRLAPQLGMQFARAVIPDEMLSKIDFKGIFEYREKSKDIYEAWTLAVNGAAAKISDADAENPGEAIQKIRTHAESSGI